MKQENKSIVIINQDSGYLMIDLANEYINAGYKVSLIAGRLVKRDKDLNHAINFSKIIRYDRSSTFKRLLTWGIATIQTLGLVWFKFRKDQLLIVSNPPTAALITLLCKNSYSLLIYDIYPDALVEFNIFSPKSLLVRIWQKANKRIYRKAERVITITAGMKRVMQKYAGEKEIEIIPIWTDNTFLKPIAKSENKFIKKYGLTGKFIILYSGNLGYAHDVEVIVELASKFENLQIQFVIIGEGDKKSILQKMIAEKKLLNCILLPYQEARDLPFSLSAADIAIVTLGKDASQLSVPSKTYNMMSVGAPLICIADAKSELAFLVNQYKCGKCFNAIQLIEMKLFIHELYNDQSKWAEYHANSLRASSFFSEKSVKKFIN